jgi:hypothetical protein
MEVYQNAVFLHNSQKSLLFLKPYIHSIFRAYKWTTKTAQLNEFLQKHQIKSHFLISFLITHINIFDSRTEESSVLPLITTDNE